VFGFYADFLMSRDLDAEGCASYDAIARYLHEIRRLPTALFRDSYMQRGQPV
jgi:hypothetical protein